MRSVAKLGGVAARLADAKRAMAAVAGEFPPEVSRSEMDGVRIEFEEGWVNIRKSNTEPYLRLIVERRYNLGEWVDKLTSAIEGGGCHAG